MDEGSDVARLTSIEAVLYRYALAYDGDDIDGAVDCFDSDGVMWASSRARPARGHAALKLMLGEARDGRRARGEQPRHLLNNVLVDVAADGRSARVTSYMTLILSRDGSCLVDCTGVYEDRLGLMPDGWKFVERRLRFDGAP